MESACVPRESENKEAHTTTYTQPTLFTVAPAAPKRAAKSTQSRRSATAAITAVDTTPREQLLLAALAAYNLDRAKLRQLAAHGEEIGLAFGDAGTLPAEIAELRSAFAALLRPTRREQIKSPADVAALLMVEMGHLDQEEMRVVNLDTKNRIQRITTVYKGSLSTAIIRVAEIFKDAIRLNSAAIVVVHNHPSADPTPSPEDCLVTREVVAAGKLLDVDVLDHIVLGRGSYVSMRQKGLGFAN